MRAIVVQKFGGPENLIIKEISKSYATAWTCLLRNLDLA